jgi:hypothetical protein
MLIGITFISPSTVSLLGRISGDYATWTFGNKPVIAVVSFSDLTEKIGIRVRVWGLINDHTLGKKRNRSGLTQIGRCKSFTLFPF